MAGAELRPRRAGAILAETRFLVFAAGQGVSAIGDGVYLVALAWTALNLTHSAVYLGLLLTTSALPRAILMLAGGVLVDRWGARRVILGSDLSRAVLVSGLAALLLLGHGSIAALFVVAGAFGVFDALFYPATTAIVPVLVSPEQLSAANGVWQVVVQGSVMVGPPLGGAIVGLFGPGLAFATDGASFLVAFGALLAIRAGLLSSPAVGQALAPGTSSFRSELASGIRAALADPFLRALLPLVAAINLAVGGPLDVGFPLLARAQHWGVGGYGLLFGGLGAGLLLGGLAMGAGLRFPRPGVSVVGMAAAGGLLMAPLGVTRSLGLAVVISGVIGGLAAVANVSIITLIQAKAPPHLLGRLSSVLMFSSVSLTPASYAISGGVARAIGVGGLFLAGAALLVAVAVVALVSPAIRGERTAGPISE